MENNNVDFSKWKGSCHALGKLLTEPKLKKDKEEGNLSETAKKHLVEFYDFERFFRKKNLLTEKIEKGLLGEEDAITLQSRLDKVTHIKNVESAENDYIKGTADIVNEIVTDVKCSWDIHTFTPNLIKDATKMYEYQLKGYCEIYDKPIGRLSYCLVNMPEQIWNKKKNRLLFEMEVATNESPEYLESLKIMEKDCFFDDMKPHLRIISMVVKRDYKFMELITPKIIKAREFLEEIQDIHNNSSEKYSYKNILLSLVEELEVNKPTVNRLLDKIKQNKN